MHSFVSPLTIGHDQSLNQSLSSSNRLRVITLAANGKHSCDIFVACLLLFFFCNVDFIFEVADSYHYQQVVKVMKTHSSFPSALSMESGIDSCADVEGIEQQETGGVGGCPEPSGFISLADCQRPSDSVGNQWAV